MSEPDDWLTDPAAIDTLVALNGLQVGDELILRVLHQDDWNIREEMDGSLVQVNDLTNCDPLHGGVTTMSNERSYRVAWVAGNWEIGRKHIKAWRRPKK